MKISDTIQQKVTIDTWDINAEVSVLSNKLSIMREQLAGLNFVGAEEALEHIADTIGTLEYELKCMQQGIEYAKKTVAASMEELSKDPLIRSYAMYEQSKDWFNDQHMDKLRSLDQFVDEDIKEEFDTLIKKYVSWEYPSIYIRPNTLNFINALKASDILYVMEQHDIRRWMYRNLPELVFKTIRFKLIDESKDNFISKKYPAGQIGFILMETFLNFKPMEIIKQYLVESMEILRPGGTLMFNYNNCDLPSGARNFEHGLYCYTPGSMLKLMCELVGFQITEEKSSDRISWLILTKPGELTTLKGGKTLGQIMADK